MVFKSPRFSYKTQVCHWYFRSISGQSVVLALLLVIIQSTERISADSFNYPAVTNPLNYSGVSEGRLVSSANYRDKRELIGNTSPSPSFQDQGWFPRFLLNLLSYSILLFPGGLIVFMVKNKLCLPQVQSFSLVRLFVYGKEESTHVHDDIELQPTTDPEDKKVHSDVGTSGTSVGKMLKLTYCFLGLQISFLAWGLLQEKIMTTEYILSSSSSDTKDTVIRFRDSQFLVLANRILALVFSMIALLLMRTRKEGKIDGYLNMRNTRVYLIAPLYEFSYCSLSNVLSSWCQYEALKYVNFPTQVLSKACKILPVMLMATLVSGKRFRSYEYLVAVSISLGMSLFLWGNHMSASKMAPQSLANFNLSASNAIHDANSLSVKSAKGLLDHAHQIQELPENGGLGYRKDEASNYSLFDGLIVLSLYLTFDSFTSNWQERLNTKYKVSTAQMMAAVNCYSILLTTTSLSQQGDLIPALKTVLSSAQLTFDCFILSLMSASGQLFIFYTISVFGAFLFTIIMTLRQSFAIILSCLIYGHALNYLSILGILIVFVSLFLQIYFKSGNKK